MKRLILPLTALVALVLELLPAVTGAAFHEYFGFAMALLLLAHAVISLRAGASPFDKVLDLLLIVVLGVCAASGLLISGTVLPAMGLFVQGGYFVASPLHAFSAKLLLALLVVHAASHIRILAAALRR